MPRYPAIPNAYCLRKLRKTWGKPGELPLQQLVDGNENPIDLSDVAVSGNGIELANREFLAAITDGREPNSSAAQELSAMRTVDRIEKSVRG